MANFKQHLLYGAGSSAAGALAGYYQFGLNEIQSGAAFILGTLGSLAPDLDHPESIPGRIFFEVLGLLVPINIIPYIPAEYTRGFLLEHWILYFSVAYLVARYLLPYIFEKITVHRGIFHSIPAAVIYGEMVFLSFIHFPLYKRITIAVIGMAGYLTHLIADECYSVDWAGNSLKNSFGSAVDLGRINKVSTWIAYAILLTLGWLIWTQITLIK